MAQLFSMGYKGWAGCIYSRESMGSTEESTMKRFEMMGEPAIAARPRATGVTPLFIVAVLLTATGCSTVKSAPKAPPLLTVVVAEVVQKDVPIYTEWIGTLDGFVNADIKAQVSGYLV